MFSTSKLEEWRRLTKTEPILEDGRTVAGQQAEVFLKSLVKNNLKYKKEYWLLFHSDGEQKPTEIEIRQLNWLSKG